MQRRHIRTLLFSIGLLLSHMAIGQLNFNLDTKEVDQDEIVCVDIVVENFDNILALQFSVNWDPAVLTFVRTENYGVNIAPSDFNTTQTNEGKLAFLWIDPGFTGQSIDDGQVLYSVCFRATGAGGTTSSVRITDDPTDIGATNGMDEMITISSNPGQVNVLEPTAGGDAVEVFYDDIDVLPNEEFCVSMKVNNADKLVALQFSLNFNPTVLRLERSANINDFEGQTFLSVATNRKDEGIVAYTWIYLQEEGANVPDGTVMFDLCFTLIADGACTSEMFMIGSVPTEPLATRAPNDQDDLGIIWNPGKIKYVTAPPLEFTTENVSGVTCSNPNAGAINLEVNGGTTGSTPTYLWSNGETTQDLSNLVEGTYSVSVTDVCLALDTLKATYTVGQEGNVPSANAGDDARLTCAMEQVTLDGTASSAGANLVIEWAGLDGQNIDAGATTLQPIVSAAGQYEILITNTSNGCSDRDTVLVTDIRSLPEADAGSDMNIQCEDAFITLTGSGSFGPEYTYNWTTTDGNIVESRGSEADVNQPGTYTLEVIESATGCSATSSVMVTGNNNRPLAAISGSTMLNCTQPTLTLNANNGGPAVANYVYTWSTTNGVITDGASAVEATISAPGDYQIRVEDTTSGCAAESAITVVADFEEPTVTSPADEAIDCANEQRTLSALGSTAANITYQWSLIEGTGQIISGNSSSTAEVMGPGLYEVFVQNTTNGCTARDTTEIVLNGELLLAQLGDDYDACETETILIGNAESGLTGRWTVIAGGANLEDPVDQNSRVNNLSEGVNTFVWTLSSSACPDYSSDTISINLVPAPIAQNDTYEITQGFGSLDIDLLSNDQLTDPENAIVTLISMPSIGSLTETGNGQFTFTVENPNASGTFTFEYEVCDDLCSMNCGVATVEITIRENVTPAPPTPVTTEPQSLGITPNGDGLNETLVFDELLVDSDSYKTKRLIVYNRWGDIVHEAQPYNNDWGGTNKSGNLLPQGTYYFVMQLDIGSGLIIEGDVTILE